MSKTKWLMAAGLIAASGAAQAGLSSTWTFTTDYDVRGITQTAHHPALQGSIDYAWDSGFSVGACVMALLRTIREPSSVYRRLSNNRC